MPNRILRDGILSSERVAQLGWADEVFYRRLMSVVDDFGRYHANPKLLRAALYPLLIDKVSDADIGKWLTSCVNAALVSVYPAPDGKRYLQLLDFRQQARADKSKFPPMSSECVADAKQTPADAPVFVFGDGDEVVEKKTARGTRLPQDWFPDDAERQFAVMEGISPDLELPRFRDYWIAQPGQKGVKTDWPATWRNWCRNAKKNPADVARVTAPPPKQSSYLADQAAHRALCEAERIARKTA